MTAKTLTLDATQRKKLAEVYRFLLQLSERRQKTADGRGPGEDRPTAASTPAEEPEIGEL